MEKPKSYEAYTGSGVRINVYNKDEMDTWIEQEMAEKPEEQGCHICIENGKPDEECEWCRVTTVCAFESGE